MHRKIPTPKLITETNGSERMTNGLNHEDPHKHLAGRHWQNNRETRVGREFRASSLELLVAVYINNNGEVRNFKIQSEREVGCELQEHGISYFFPKQGLAESFKGTDPLVACITVLPRE